tara:strand:- start:575 stop:1561 length:987 start_codon:yes stop_codon:yes gene_type:complete
MIIKQFEINKINFKDKNYYLFYGENDGHKNEVLANYFKPFYINKIYKYDEKEVLENKNNFFDKILNKSFFEDNKLIIISRASDKIKETIQEIISKKISDITIILLAGILEKKSKLRNFFEKEKDLLCIPFYFDSIQTLNKISINFFNEKKIAVSQEVINLLIDRCRGDRENLKNELQKIEAFSKSEKKISYENIFKLTNLAENYNASELTDNCLAKNVKKTANILNENNYSTDDCILIIRTLLIKAKRLLKLQEYMNNNKSIEQAIISYKPPIFWKDKDIVKQQITQWSLEKIKSLIVSISEIELLIKKNSTGSLNILSDFILTQAKK